MPQNTLTIRFKAEGKDELKAAFAALGNASKKLAVDQGKLQKALSDVKKKTKDVTKTVDENNKTWHHFNRNMFKGKDIIGKVGREMSILRSRLLIVAFAVGAVTAAVKKLTDAFEEEVKLNAKLNAVLKATSNASGLTSRRLNELANTYQKTMGVSATAVKDMQVRLLTFTAITGANFERTQRMAINLSAAFGQDLNQSAIQLGKALQEPTVGLGALRRVGVSFTNSQKEMITQLEKSGQIFAAQQKILSVMESQLGETAIAQTEAAIGSDAMRLAGEELMETLRALGAIIQPLLLFLGKLGEALLKEINIILNLVRAIYTLDRALLESEFKIVRYTEKLLGIQTAGFTNALEGVQKNLKIMNDELGTLNPEFEELAKKAGLFDPSLLAGMVKEIKELGENETSEELLKSLASLIADNNAIIGDNIALQDLRKKAIEKSEEALRKKLAMLQATNAQEKLSAELGRKLTDTEIELVAAIEEESNIQRILKENIGKTTEAKINALNVDLVTLQTQRDIVAAKADAMRAMAGETAPDFLGGGLIISQEEIDEMDASVSKFDEAATNIMDTIQKLKDSMSGGGDDGGEDDIPTKTEIFMDAQKQMMEALGERVRATQEAARAEMSAIDERAKREIEAFRGTAKFRKMTDKQRAAEEKKINDKAAKDKEKAKKQANKEMLIQFRIDQIMRVRETLMSTKAGVMNALAMVPPNLPLAAVVGAMGAASMAMIAAQKPPKMARGGLVGGRRHAQGGTMIEAEQGEFVMSRDAVNTLGVETMNRINQGGGRGNVNVTFSGNVLSDDFIENEAIPQIRDAIRRGADIGVS